MQISMPKIKFIHPFKKLLAAPTGKALLLDVFMVDMESLSPQFIAYDTDNGAYSLPKTGRMMMLLFLGDNGTFTTMRSCWPMEKIDYYRSNVGKMFEIVITTPFKPAPIPKIKIIEKPAQVTLFT